jgi:hypothetical protein
MLDIGICSLRGVYDIDPAGAAHAQKRCAVAGQTVTGCAQYYYTSSCLLYCDGVFYDPCLCKSLDSVCQPSAFEPSQCSAGVIFGGQHLLASDEGLLTSSLLWPLSVALGETQNDTQWEMVLQGEMPGHAIHVCMALSWRPRL